MTAVGLPRSYDSIRCLIVTLDKLENHFHTHIYYIHICIFPLRSKYDLGKVIVLILVKLPFS